MAEESRGGRATAVALGALPHDVWHVLNDVPWPGRPHVTIDHVVVGPAGVFVIEVKAWSGEVSVRNGVLYQDRYARQGAISRVSAASKAIARQLRTASGPVRPVLCLVREKWISIECGGALVCTTANVAELLQSGPRVLAAGQVQRVAHELAGRALPRVAAPGPRSARSGRVAYLGGAVVALAAALLLITRPDGAADAVRDLVGWVATHIEDAR